MDTRYGQSLDVGKLLGTESSVENNPPVIKEIKEEKQHSVPPTDFVRWFDKNIFRIVLVFLVIFSIAVLVQPKNLDRIDSSVRNSLIAQYEQQAIAGVLKEFSDASAEQKRVLVDKRVYELTSRPEFEQNINVLSAQYKSFYRDNNGQTFLYSADPYYYFRLARNLVEHNSLTGTGEKDVLRFFPFGDVTVGNVFPFVLFYFFKTINMIFPFVSLLTATFYFPVVAGVISVLLVFLIGQKISGFNAGFFSALVFLLHPVFLFWNYAGYADTQVLALTFSLAGILLFLYGVDFSHKFRAFFSWIVLFMLWKYADFVWSGLFFVPVLFILVGEFFVIIWFVQRALVSRKFVFLFGILLVFVFTAWFVYSISEDYRGRALVMLNLVPVSEVFPTAFSSITELEGAGTFGRFVVALGGYLFVFLVFVELWFFVRSFKSKIEMKLLLPWVWLLLFIVPAFLSSRFLFFLLPPFVLIAGRTFTRVGFLFEKFVSFILKLKLSSSAVKLLSLIAVSVLIFFVVNPSPFVAKTKLPLVTQSFVDSAEFIRSHSRNDAVIATAFDLGYAWQAFSRRATFFDGGLFKTPREYWLANALMSTDENKSLRVFKSMNCGDDIYWAYGKFPEKYVYCSKTNDVFVAITESMLYQMHLFDYYVNWDFDAARLRQEIRGRSFDNATAFLQSAYNFSEDDAVEAYYSAKSFEEDIPAKHVGEISHCRADNATILCNDGLIIDTKSLSVKIEGRSPKSLVFVKGGKRTVVVFNNSDETFSAVVYQSGSEYRSVLMDAELTNTFLVRLFSGEKLNYFEPVFISGEKPYRVVVYKMKLYRKGG